MKIGPHLEEIPETYEEAVQVAADGLDFGTDHMADLWGPALSFKLGEREEEVAEKQGNEYFVALHEVYVDILVKALADETKLLNHYRNGGS